ncbi:beta-lactamase hydrolase domain-containing protein [Pleionea litopenaei]|uniref:Sulfur transferase domain-containing protein n=1 Tax=Pleionea litopenaei TaxID=3070815 RepID=A0AA51RUP6_9GAMM|nr:sulfur transferase domain-containing protein [Pleionea sp. HL-JVS1]WMS87860.1 sulfur transferase domain-containing protein [Pleionea sp. HL-JVS1]
MNITKLNSQVSVSGQLDVSMLDELVKQGVEVIVCNRPDNEESNQISAAILADAALSRSLEFYNIPFGAQGPTKEQVHEFANLLKTEKTIHAYCRTGNRSSNLFNAATQLMDQM